MRPIDGAFQLQIGPWIDVPLGTALQDWRDRPGALPDRLAEALREAIQGGDLPAGTRLPPERVLATYVGVGRRTVARAYQVLEKSELVERRQGSGTIVSGVDPSLQGDRSSKLATSLQRNIVFQSFGHAPEPTIDLLSAYAPTSDAVTSEIFKLAAVELERFAVDHHGYRPTGYPPLRAMVADRLTTQGIPTAEDEVLITSGAQQAISLIAATFVKPGQVVIVEDPTIPGAIDAFRTAGARLLTVPVREGGADVHALTAMLARNRVGAVYLMPTYQSPTGTVMPIEARRRVAELAEHTEVPVVEDATLADLSIMGDPPPLLAAFSNGGPVLSIGSLSKLFWAGLRVGWIRAPRTLIAHLARLKAVNDLGTSTLTQAVAVSLMEHLDRMKDARRREFSVKLELIESLLRATLHGWEWRTPAGGLCLWARLPAGNALELTYIAKQHGVAITPGTITSATNSFEDYVRLPFGYQADVIEEGIARLTTAWNAYLEALAGQSRDVRVVV